MQTAAFDYELPRERIAQQPRADRASARLLVDRGTGCRPRHARVRDLPELLEPGDLVVVNDTRVLPARLALRKDTGGAAEVLLLGPRGDGTWEALVRPSRRLPPGTVLRPAHHADPVPLSTADVDPTSRVPFAVEVGEDLGEGRRIVRLDTGDGAGSDDGPGHGAAGVHDGAGGLGAVLDALERHGELPLPPYIEMPLEEPDRYQTVYAARAGSVAAPTAGLHLDDAVLDALAEHGVRVAPVELVVGLGTFRPIAADRVEDHVMHAERYRVPPDTWAALEQAPRVVAIGTTVVRALESAAETGELDGSTDLFIHGERRIRVVDRLLTNFHLPRSSLLVLVDAFVGPRWRELYEVALAGDYRFLSFGDAMLLTRRDLLP